LLYPFGPERFESSHLGFNIISFDIQMNTAWMIDLLHLDMQIFWVRLQPNVTAILRSTRGSAGQAECAAPKIGCCV
jgi:hypothetical protein